MKHRLLIIADAHQNMLEGVRALLSSLFEAVLMVADEASLHQAATDVSPDLLIVDLSLPVAGKGNILRALRSRETLPSTKVIVMSIHDETEAVQEAFAAGAKGYVLKRSAVTEMVPAVKQVLLGQTYVSPGVRGDGDVSLSGVEGDGDTC